MHLIIRVQHFQLGEVKNFSFCPLFSHTCIIIYLYDTIPIMYKNVSCCSNTEAVPAKKNSSFWPWAGSCGSIEELALYWKPTRQHTTYIPYMVYVFPRVVEPVKTYWIVSWLTYSVKFTFIQVRSHMLYWRYIHLWKGMLPRIGSRKNSQQTHTHIQSYALQMIYR